MTYYIMSERRHCGDGFEEVLRATTETEAIAEATDLFDRMCDADKKNCTRFDLCKYDGGEFEDRLDDIVIADLLNRSEN